MPRASSVADLVEQPALELLVDAARHALGDLRRRQPEADRHHVDIRAAATRCRRSARSAAARSGRTLRARGPSASGRAAESAAPTPDRPAAASGAGTVTSRRSAIASRRCAQRGVAPGPGKQPARQRAVVEAGAADENRQPPARVDVADRRGRVARVLRRGVFRRSDRRCRSDDAECRAARPAPPCRCRCRTRGRRRSNRS